MNSRKTLVFTATEFSYVLPGSVIVQTNNHLRTLKFPLSIPAPLSCMEAALPDTGPPMQSLGEKSFLRYSAKKIKTKILSACMVSHYY